MKSFVFKNRLLLSILFGIICSIPVFYLNRPSFFVKSIFASIFFTSNAVLLYTLILKYIEKHSEYRVSFFSKKMELYSNIFVKNEFNPIDKVPVNIACFQMKNEEILISFAVESNKVSVTLFMDNEVKKYTQLNIDSIMIKPNKSYSVMIKKETTLFNGIEVESVYIPVAIDYYNLEDKFYTYDLKTVRK